MKNTRKVFSLALIAAIGFAVFSLTICDNGTTESSNGDGITSPAVFKSVSAMGTWLSAQPANTAATAYSVVLKTNNISIIRIPYGKYVNLDLSGSTFTSIGGNAFDDCSSLTSVTIGNSVKSIGLGAFRFCTSLTSVTIGNSVKSIGNGAFIGCTGLTSIVIPDSVTWIDKYAFDDCSRLTNVTIPKSVTSIESGVFSGCISLASITIPDSVTSIGNATFESSGLTSIVIPDSVTWIGNQAFTSCVNLTSVTFQGTIPSGGLMMNSFSGDLYNKYRAGGVGTYTTTAPVNEWSVWTKK